MFENINSLDDLRAELETIENALILVYSNMASNGPVSAWERDKYRSVFSLSLDGIRALKGDIQKLDARMTEQYNRLRAAYEVTA